jgi:putative hydrolase of the HAD superfamily
MTGSLAERIDAIVLDVGGVFLIPHHDPVAEALTPHGLAIDPARIDHAHYAGVVALDACDGDDGPHTCYLAAFAGTLGIPEADLGRATRVLAELWTQPSLGRWRRLVAGSTEALRQLVESGHTVAILSNSDGTVEEQLRELSVCQIGEGAGVTVRHIADSAIVGVAKPDPRIFHLVAEAIGVPPERCLYVGDTVRYDVIGARAAGFHPLHFDPLGLCASADTHEHIAALSELATLLRAPSA